MDNNRDIVMQVAGFMALSARTAPKAKGEDFIVTRVLSGDEITTLARAMRSYGEEHGIGFFIRDAGNMAASAGCLLIGVRGQEAAGVNCQGCGYANCDAMVESLKGRSEGTPYTGPNCVLRVTDLGIAAGSAVKTASLHNVDNRIMYSAGAAARLLGWLGGSTIALGIPLSVSGKNIFFDR
ncbi:MAG: DUF2148 domain-containing protein [Methanoregulaceae archaeon]|nr:DUF2148 domain-containing protein [Methanoregulaceae archaeon]